MLKLYPECANRFTDTEQLRRYIYGGKGVITLLSPSGVHHTYYYKKPRNEDEFPDDVIFVYAVHDRCKLFYVGMIESGIFRLTRWSRFNSDTDIVKGAKFVMKLLQYPNYINETRMIVQHEGMCSVCGRKLTNPKSLMSGIGPRCARKLSDREKVFTDIS